MPSLHLMALASYVALLVNPRDVRHLPIQAHDADPMLRCDRRQNHFAVKYFRFTVGLLWKSDRLRHSLQSLHPCRRGFGLGRDISAPERHAF
jgi:hypothetical protein